MPTAACFNAVLRHLASTPPDCLMRANYTANATSHPSPYSHFPVYVMHAPWLHARHAFMERQLQVLGAADVTWVLCSNRNEVDALSPSQRECAYPCVQLGRYYDMNATTGNPIWLTNGTISLALKHKLAAWDMHERGVRHALMLEDDAILPPLLWPSLHYLARVPLHIDIFWMGSYSSRMNRRAQHHSARPGFSCTLLTACRVLGPRCVVQVRM